ncbi:hypothetical protein [Geosporobacter ferrireducens]|uniref:Uncharacterized protein n=1 Tax=Geosporobacter ferrireducens TaxID=1424294 RepID=A0A1D8GLB0_9FIRM|nr:hypothetical protein [Geosporobacter ferrireducens]AOT71696.1 hypothetical protein Gferi_20445 [Geosporobacter ferrireducens]MTI55470.1 hypothetical protein [Geosporobacter ferrireducens]
MTKDIDLDEHIIRRKKIPILIESKEWRSLFEKAPTKQMLKISKDLEAMLVEEKSGALLIRNCKKQKKALMERILKLSDEVNSVDNPVALEQLEATKKAIIDMNQQIEELQFKLDTLPREIDRLNLELLKESVGIAYEDIRNNGKEIPKLTEEILQLRQSLTEKWEEKIQKETRVQELYSYLHNTLGHEETDKLDKKFL